MAPLFGIHTCRCKKMALYLVKAVLIIVVESGGNVCQNRDDSMDMSISVGDSIGAVISNNDGMALVMEVQTISTITRHI